jgi:hypothetical protein
VRADVAKRRAGRPPHVNAELDARIYEQAVQHPTWSVADRVLDLRLQGLATSESSVRRSLQRQHFSRKRVSTEPDQRNSAHVKSDRMVVAQRILKVPNENLVFLDETGLTPWDVSLFGYSRVGEKCFVKVPGSQGPRANVIAVVCKVGVVAWKMLDGPLTGESFEKFIREDLLPAATRLFGDKRMTLVMDNLGAHHSDTAQVWLRTKFDVLYNAAYTPQLNAIENVFHQVKAAARATLSEGWRPHQPQFKPPLRLPDGRVVAIVRQGKRMRSRVPRVRGDEPTLLARKKERLQQAITSGFAKITSENMAAYINDVKMWCGKALQLEDFH